LSWHDHIQYNCSKTSKTINIITKLTPYVTRQSLISIYYAIVQPYLTYACVLGRNNYEVSVSQLIKLQRRVVGVIKNVPLRELIIKMFQIKFSKQWRYARAPSACRISANNTLKSIVQCTDSFWSKIKIAVSNYKIQIIDAGHLRFSHFFPLYPGWHRPTFSCSFFSRETSMQEAWVGSRIKENR